MAHIVSGTLIFLVASLYGLPFILSSTFIFAFAGIVDILIKIYAGLYVIGIIYIPIKLFLDFRRGKGNG